LDKLDYFTASDDGDPGKRDFELDTDFAEQSLEQIMIIQDLQDALFDVEIFFRNFLIVSYILDDLSGIAIIGHDFADDGLDILHRRLAFER
jgi:hypothetical protein